jgi:FAD:protein FMN transferase
VVGVADPARSEDNAAPMATVGLVNQSVATSGSYARGFTVGGKRYSHILDPRTGRPVATSQAATVVAKDTVTADALATALCVLPAARGVGLVNLIPNTECLVVGADGRKLTSRRWSLLAKSGDAGTPAAKPGGGSGGQGGRWPAGNAVTIKLSLKQQSRKSKRPYMAAWVADRDGRPIKMLALWGSKSKYHKKLSAWYRLGSSFREQARSVTRASRSAGVYTLTWDGTDRSGKGLPTGAYTVYVEIVRDKGSHVVMTASIDCAAAPDSAKMRANAESDGASITYGPRGK